MQAYRNWEEQRRKGAFLALEDGTLFEGYSAGAPVDRLGEVVFNTGMTGYQEILTDPSYHGQLVALTYPEIGNTGVNDDDMESRDYFANGLLVHRMNMPSSRRADHALDATLIERGLPCLAGLDTRALTMHLREKGTLKGFLCVTGDVSKEEGIERARQWEGLDGRDCASEVSVKTAYLWDQDGHQSTSWGLPDTLPPPDMRIVAYDYGIKWNILRCLRWQGMQIEVVPATTTPAEVLARKPDGVFLSNGPGDPAAVKYAVAAISELIGKVPLMGICLGHQLLGLALGGTTYRLKFGHHGCNHPVKNLSTGAVEITSQNHNFALCADRLDRSNIELTHINLNDGTVEGIRHRREPAFSVQYHPEAAPGPHDPVYLFEQFSSLVR